MSGFDVLHAHGDDYWLWRRRVKRHVRTMHGSCISEALRISGNKEKLRMLLLGLGELLATKIADTTVAVSENTRRSMPWIPHVIPNGVNTQALGQRVAARDDRPTILFVGTYLNRKRGRFLMEVFAEAVQPALPDAQLWMVCTDAPSAHGVEVLGRLTDQELRERYQRSWLFCLPSTYEGFGIPYAEAMAAGLPVVATPNPGALEVVGTTGGRVVRDAELGNSLVQLLTDHSERRRLAGSAQRAAQRFALTTVAASYEELYAASNSKVH